MTVFRMETRMKLKNMTIENIANACKGTYIGDKALLKEKITGVEKDSRLIEKGYLYLPFVGARVDGHDFIHKYLRRAPLFLYRKKIWKIQKDRILK